MSDETGQNGGANPFPQKYLAVITPEMEARLNENRRSKAEKAGVREGLSRADAQARAAATPRVQVSADRKTIVLSNGALAGYATHDRDGKPHLDEDGKQKLVWTTVVGAPQDQFDRIRHRSVKGEQKGTKPLSLSSAKAAFTRYWKNREFKSDRSRKAAMQMDLNYAPADENDIVTTKRYLRNPGKFDYKGFDDSTGPLSKFYDPTRDPDNKKYVPGSAPMELHKRKAHPNPRSKVDLSAQWPVREFQEQNKEGQMVTVRHRVDAQGNKLQRSPENRRSHRAAKQTPRKPGQSEAAYKAELAAKAAQAKAKRASVKASKPASSPKEASKSSRKNKKAQAGGSQQEQQERQQRQQRQQRQEQQEQEQEEQEQQRGGRAVSLKTAVRLLRSYYNNKYNQN